MIEIGHTLVSEELFTEHFVCDLDTCKGACCIEGDAGAPLSEEETDILEREYPNFKAFLRPEGIEYVEKLGTSVIDFDGEPVTPLRDGKECAYTVFEGGKAMCGIEKAWKAGATSFRKPLSCHLYPIRTKEYVTFEAMNYDRWEVCSPACSLGNELKVPVYAFLKEALIRKYGDDWFQELHQAFLLYKKTY